MTKEQEKRFPKAKELLDLYDAAAELQQSRDYWKENANSLARQKREMYQLYMGELSENAVDGWRKEREINDLAYQIDKLEEKAKTPKKWYRRIW